MSSGYNLYSFNADEEKEVRVRLSKCLMEDIIIAQREIAFFALEEDVSFEHSKQRA